MGISRDPPPSERLTLLSSPCTLMKCCLHDCHKYEEGFAIMLLIPHSQTVRTPHCQIVNPTLQAFYQNATNPTLSNCQPHIASILPKCYQSHIVKLSTPHCNHFAKMLPIPHCQIINSTLQSFCQNATNPTSSNS